MKIITKQILGLMMFLSFSSVSADDEDLKNSVVQHRLSLAAALQAAESSVVSCRKQGLDVSSAVVDANGILQVVLRDTMASPISAKLSQKKAYTAANFLKDTTHLADLSDTAVGRSDGILMSAGGVLIKVDDIVYGAIGVSGASTGAKDDECARAGLKAISESLSVKPVEKTDKAETKTEETKKK